MTNGIFGKIIIIKKKSYKRQRTAVSSKNLKRFQEKKKKLVGSKVKGRKTLLQIPG